MPKTKYLAWILFALFIITPLLVGFGNLKLNSQVGSASLLSAASQPASFSDPQVSSTVVNQNTQFSLKWTDPTGISGYIFSFDPGSGTFYNQTYVPLQNSTTAWTNSTETIYGSPGERIQWMYYVQDGNGTWSKSYTYAFVAGLVPSAVSFSNFMLITDDAYDLLAYDGVNLANLGNFPQFVGTYGPDVGFHEVVWNPQGTEAIAIGYNNSAVLYTLSTGSISVLSTGASSDTNLVGIAWTPNGTSAVITGSDPDVILTYSTVRGNFTQVPNLTGISGLGQISWNPTSNYGIIDGSDGLIKYSANGTLSVIPSAAGIPFESIDFDPNGTLALLGTQDGALYEYNSVTSDLSLATTLSSTTQLKDITFSLDGSYALVSAQSGSTNTLYEYNGHGLYAITTGNDSLNEISFSQDDSNAAIATSGGILNGNYGSNTTSFTTIASATQLLGIGFLPPAITTTVNSTSTNSSLGSISISSNGPYTVGEPISFSGQTLAANGTAVASQTIYIWVDGQEAGSVASNQSGYWTFSSTPNGNGTYYVVASQNQNGSGVTSKQLALNVLSQSATTTTTHTTSVSNSTTSASTQTTATITLSTNSTTSISSTSTTSSTTSSISASTSSTQSSTSSSSSSVISSTNSTSTQTASTTASPTSSSSINPYTSSYTSSQQSSTNSKQQNFAALFLSIPYITTNSPTALGTAIFMTELGLVISCPLVIRKIVRRARGEDEGRGWRW